MKLITELQFCGTFIPFSGMKIISEPFGRALLAYFEGDVDTELIIQWDDGQEATLPMRGLVSRGSWYSVVYV